MRSETQHKEWQVKEKESALTDRDSRYYRAALGFNPEEFRGKTILDVGSGKKEEFSKEAEVLYDIKVFSVNPQLKDWKTRKKLQGWIFRDPEWQKRSIAARGQELPFDDESFDAITSLYAITFWVESEDRHEAIREMIRVLKPGGRIYLSPRGTNVDAFSAQEITSEEVLGEETIQWLKGQGCSVNDDKTGPIVITKGIEEK